jgi:hypothetical protein
MAICKKEQKCAIMAHLRNSFAQANWEEVPLFFRTAGYLPFPLCSARR